MNTQSGPTRSKRRFAFGVLKLASLALFLGVLSCSQETKEDGSIEGAPQGSSFKTDAKPRPKSALRSSMEKTAEMRDEMEKSELEEAFKDIEPVTAFTGNLDSIHSMMNTATPAKTEAGWELTAGRNANNDPGSPNPNAGPNSNNGLGGGGGGAGGAGGPVTGTSVRRNAERASSSKKSKSDAATKRVKTWKPAKAESNAARLSVGNNDDLDAQGMQISVAIDGWRARVVIDAYFVNPRAQQLEGTFKLRLPDGASPYYFAFGQTVFGEGRNNPKVDENMSPVYFKLDEQGDMKLNPYEIGSMRARTWEKVRESKMVPKEKAAHAYIETTRRRIDPALMEWNGAGIFSARVFPLMPKQLHRIVIGYDLDLTQAGDDLVAKINVPAGLPSSRVDLGLHKKLTDVRFRASVKPTKKTHDSDLLKHSRQFYTWEDAPAGEIEIRLDNPGVISMNGQQDGRGHFRAARVKVDLDSSKDAVSKSEGVFMLDTSYSTDPTKFNVWLSLLEATLTNNRDVLPTFNVLFFSIDQHWYSPKAVENTPEAIKALMEYCNRLALEGATDLNAALRSGMRANEPVSKLVRRRFFLLSDGASTWGDSNRDALIAIAKRQGNAGLYAYRTGMSGSDSAMLNALAVASGGAVFSVAGAEEVTKASKAFRAKPWKIESISHQLGRNELIEGRPTHVYPDQMLKVVATAIEAKILGPAKITLMLERDGEKKTLTFPIKHTIDSHFAGRVYGQVATSQLEDLVQMTEDSAAAFARHFRITGRTCSLLMLESEADYTRYNIVPKNDAFVVGATKVPATIAKAEKDLGAQRGSPKAAFVHWATKLQSMPGVSFEMSAALKLLMENLPSGAFAVPVEALPTTLRMKDQLAPAYLKMLNDRKPVYDTVMKDADKRKLDASNADQLKALSTLVENRPGDLVLGRDVAFSASNAGFGGHSYHLLKRVRDSRPWEPITYHAMAKNLRASGKNALAMLYYEIALRGQWNGRYGEFKRIVAVDYQDFMKKLVSQRASPESANNDATKLMHSFIQDRQKVVQKTAGIEEAGLLITMTWNTDSTDIDLHVVEPTGEECFYSHPNTKLGGKITRDVTEGFGPEMYTLKKARAGVYTIAANFYGNNSNRSSVATKVEVKVHRNFGTANHTVTTRVVSLGTTSKKVEVLKISVK